MYKVEGFEFETKTQASAAKKEVEGIKYIKEHTCMTDPDTVLSLYNRLILKEVFSTPVGYAFLGELQTYLRTIPYIKSEDILPIPIYRPEDILEDVDDSEHKRRRAAAEKALANNRKAIQKKNRKDQRERQKSDWQASFTARTTAKNYRTQYIISTFFAVVFGLALVGTFVITALSGNNVTIINYENAIIDKYEVWEAQLKEWELELRIRESALEQRENNHSEEQDESMEDNGG